MSQRPLNEIRHWTIVGGDGIPYVLGQRLRENYDHLKNLLLLPGPGHFEINFVKALFKLLWPVGLQTLVKFAGYRTDKALPWARLCIYFESVAQILLQQYVEYDHNPSQILSFKGYQSWLKGVCNPYHYQAMMISRYMLALLMYRQGIRDSISPLRVGDCVIIEQLFSSNKYAQLHGYPVPRSSH